MGEVGEKEGIDRWKSPSVVRAVDEVRETRRETFSMRIDCVIVEDLPVSLT